MRFNNWYRWMKTKPWSLRWFIILILIRPVIDNFYFLKNLSPFASPLFWIGALTPLLCAIPIIKYSYRNNLLHRIFNWWSLLVFLNSAFILFQPVGVLSQVQWVLRLTMLFYIFAFLRVFIRNRVDFHGLLTTFMYAAAIASLMLLYELVFHPIKIASSRGLERIQGGYADVMNYAIYLSFGFLILVYFFISYKIRRKGLKINFPFIFIAAVFCIAGFIGISHAASYAVFAVLLLMLILFTMRRFSTISATVIILGSIAFAFLGDNFYSAKIDPLMKNEIEIVQGKRAETQMFHGRMSRWKYAWENFKDNDALIWVLGYPVSNEDPFFNISIGIHNDYLRIFYFTGLTGIFLYLLYLFNIWKRNKFLFLPERFVLYGTLAILIIYSITTTPTLYANFLYILFTVFVYFSLPVPQLISDEST